MRFKSTRAAAPLSFLDAALRGYPADGGFYMPADDADIRSSVYAPADSFADVIALSASELLSSELDPRQIAMIVRHAYFPEPTVHHLDDDIFILDLTQGPGASAADYGAAFTAAFMERAFDPVEKVVLAAASGREASALALAFSALGKDNAHGLRLVLLCPEGESVQLPVGTGCASVVMLGVKGGISAARALERRASGESLLGRGVIPGGSATPVRLLGRSLLLIGLFSLARRGLSGDLIVAAPSSDLLGLVTGLWAWSWGLPVSAFLLPRRPGEPSSALLIDLLSGFAATDGSSGAEFLERFDAEYPLGSLVLRAPTASGPDMARVLADGFVLDAAAAQAATAAREALSAGLAGHARIAVPCFAHPFWEGAPAPLRFGPGFQAEALMATIEPNLAALEASLGRLAAW